MDRRKFLKKSSTLAALLIAVKTGLLRPETAWAERNHIAFETNNLNGIEEVINLLFPGLDIKPATQIRLKLPSVAENGLYVPVAVDASKRNDVLSLSILAENNHKPLVASYRFNAPAVPYLKTRIKVVQSTPIHAIIETTSGLELATAEVTVNQLPFSP